MSDELPDDEHPEEGEKEPREDLETDGQRHENARETTNPDDHRDEEPHN
jgi:hypothetical protein